MYIIDLIKKNISLVVCLLIYLAVAAITPIGCPILFITGIPCLGCGMTRAVVQMIRLDPEQAFHMHPLCFFLPLFTGFIIYRGRLNKRLYNICTGIIVFLFVSVYLIRLFNPEDTLVKIRISNGLIYKLLIIFKERGICL